MMGPLAVTRVPSSSVLRRLSHQGLRMKFCWVIDGMESGVIQGVSLKLGDLHVGEEVSGRILDPG